MSIPLPRRAFLKTSALAGAGVWTGAGGRASLAQAASPTPDLHTLSEQLARQWAAALLRHQVVGPSQSADYGGLRGPGDAAVPGRCAEAMYPLLRLASHTGEARYLDAAQLLYYWAERRVSQPDGSWLNEPQLGSWKGTTVFMATALAESLKRYGALLDGPLQAALTARLLRAGNFIYQTFTIDYGNINYPIAAAYGLALLGEVLDVPRFRQRGRALAHEALRFITPGGLLFGEGQPHTQASPKGCYSIDLGYNVEESLPALALYGLLTDDEQVLASTTHALQAHLEFMLPDGGWDNSWGTRSYKWTYWGSRTSDGCQPAYVLLAGRDPRFYEAALRNTELLQRCTTPEGLLAGGAHAAAQGLPTSVHHTFCHLKALTVVLDRATSPATPPKRHRIMLPREQAVGSRFVADAQTWLLAQGAFRATVTGYDREYQHYYQGHATGGALTLLWHPRTGPLLAASMTEYQLYEAGNMVPAADQPPLCLTPRVELRLAGELYTNISDLAATVVCYDIPTHITLTARGRLVNKSQQNPPAGELACTVTYSFSANQVTLDFDVAPSSYDPQLRIWLPLVAQATDPVVMVTDRRVSIGREAARVEVAATQPFASFDPNQRVFNPVPGLAAVPLCVVAGAVRLTLTVS